VAAIDEGAIQWIRAVGSAGFSIWATGMLAIGAGDIRISRYGVSDSIESSGGYRRGRHRRDLQSGWRRAGNSSHLRQ